MNAPISLPADYMDSLLRLSDEKKLHVIHVLTESLVKPVRSTTRKNVNKRTKDKQSTEDYIKSLMVKGGDPVPPDVNGIESLIEAKYL
jgi:hypothetical protein